jgi:hypothetical protein
MAAAKKREQEQVKPTAMNSADPIRNFTLTVDERIRALTIGVPAWAARKRKIEDDEERFVDELIALHDKLVAKGLQSGMQLDIAIATAANTLDLTKINKLKVDHNRWYPVEANLPMDRKGNYLVYGRVWLPDEPLTGVILLARARERIAKRDAPPEEDEG